MTETTINLNSNMLNIRLVSLNTAVIGSGAAGFNAADRLWSYGQKDVAIVTEGINVGTSRNTGSDKQTYYKLSLSGEDLDSVSALAQVLFEGQCVDGDIALCEAALSAQCFLRLAELGVPFPKNRYGEYVGYKTDHDPNRRATSVGPYTSRMMTEALEQGVSEKNIKIFDGLQVVKFFTGDEKVLGFLCIDKNVDSVGDCFVLFNCRNVILATGGPAGMYANSVFPLGHYGATGLAFEAGVRGKNLTEWQFGLASVKPRWNVSGTYMQVMPRFISTDWDGGDEQEFLSDFFPDKGEMLSKVFLKGYQWPFDVRKVCDGSSIIDILVYIETEIKGRRVFLDFRKNPKGEEIDFTSLSAEALEYLKRGNTCFGTPIERLCHMNAPAVSFYSDRGVDLKTEALEIALCAQHNNGGLDIDLWWQTNVEGFFAAGEVAGSHGVYRPGGSALNSGQVGSTRAAQYIAEKRTEEPLEAADFLEDIKPTLLKELEKIMAIMGTTDNLEEIKCAATERMSKIGGAVRSAEYIKIAYEQLREEIDTFTKTAATLGKPIFLARACRLRETLICQYVYLGAMLDYTENGGKSRGSALYTDKNGELAFECLPETFRLVLDDNSRGCLVQLAQYSKKGCSFQWRPVREIPHEDEFFENVWRSFRENKNIY